MNIQPVLKYLYENELLSLSFDVLKCASVIDGFTIVSYLHTENAIQVKQSGKTFELIRVPLAIRIKRQMYFSKTAISIDPFDHEKHIPLYSLIKLIDETVDLDILKIGIAAITFLSDTRFEQRPSMDFHRLEYLTDYEKGELHRLKLLLPSYGEQRSQAAQRVRERLLNRRLGSINEQPAKPKASLYKTAVINQIGGIFPVGQMVSVRLAQPASLTIETNWYSCMRGGVTACYPEHHLSNLVF